MRKQKTLIVMIFIILIVISACSGSTDANEKNGQLIISVSVLPQKYFVERIGGEHVQVNLMVGPGDSPHSYEPKASQMTALSDSEVYFQIGVEFENAWMDRIAGANPAMLIVDVSADIAKIEMAAHGHDDKDESNHNEKSILDPHIWTSPANGILIAETIAETLVALDPQHTDDYQSNLASLIKDIEKLQNDIKIALENKDSDEFMVFHPAWGYFAQEFGLQQIPIEIGGSEPSARELADIITKARSESIDVIFAQPEFSTRSAEYIASEIGGKVILISPLAENWLENLRFVANTFAEEL